jgi:hypothetical protein
MTARAPSRIEIRSFGRATPFAGVEGPPDALSTPQQVSSTGTATVDWSHAWWFSRS